VASRDLLAMVVTLIGALEKGSLHAIQSLVENVLRSTLIAVFTSASESLMLAMTTYSGQCRRMYVRKCKLLALDRSA
jgi:hypothetical protein